MIAADFRVDSWSTASGDEEWSGVSLIHVPCGREVSDVIDGVRLDTVIAAAEAHTCPPGRTP